MSVSLVLNYEEGAELCIGDGDPEGERVGEFVYPTMDSQTRDLGIESTFEYGSRVGTWRVLDLFDEFDAKATIFACGRALERNPLVARAFTARGHEVAGHGYRWVDHFRMEPDHEREQIRLAVASIEETTGERPLGWYCRYAPSVNTRRLLLEEGGFLYDYDSYADEVPYWVKVGDKHQLIVPYQLDANDAKFFRGPGWSGAKEFGDYLRDSVDCLLKEGHSAPKMLSVGLHGRIIGRPGRCTALAQFLEYCRATQRVSLLRRVDIARWWHERYPPWESSAIGLIRLPAACSSPGSRRGRGECEPGTLTNDFFVNLIDMVTEWFPSGIARASTRARTARRATSGGPAPAPA